MTEIPSNVSEWKEKIVSYFHAVSDDTKKQVATLTDSENPVNWEGYKNLSMHLMASLPEDFGLRISAILASPSILAFSVVALMHHATTAAITMNLHRNKTHRAVELDPLLVALSELLIRPNTTIVAKEWVAAHTQHHRESDNLWSMESERLGDPHSPRAIAESGKLRFLKQWLDLVGKKEYFDAVDVIYRNSAGDTEIPDTRVTIEGRKPGNIARFGPSAALAASYMGMFGLKVGGIMGVSQALLGSGTVTLVNGIGHGAEERKGGEKGDHSRNITSDGKTWLGRRWNDYLSFQCVGEEHHGNHHEAMMSADITLGDPKQFDMGYYYLRKLEEFGLASNFRVSDRNAAKIVA